MAAALFVFLKTHEDFACLRTGLGAIRGASRSGRTKMDTSDGLSGCLSQHTSELGS